MDGFVFYTDELYVIFYLLESFCIFNIGLFGCYFSIS